jgi:hypothetical protein
MAHKFQDNSKRSLTSPLSKEKALFVLTLTRFDLIEITDQSVLRDAIAAHIKTCVDAGAALDS